MKSPKFLLCENPLAEQSDGRVFVLHAREPLILAEAFHFAADDEEAQMAAKKFFNVAATLDYSPDEYVVLGALWYREADADTLAKIMRRMADWYESYLKWEDEKS